MIEVKFTPRQLKSIETAISKLGDVKTANQVVSKAARIAAKVHLLPQSKKATPKQSGVLRKSTKIRAIKRKKDTAGVSIGYSDKDFTGDAFYGGFVEYGFKVGPRRLGDARKSVKGQFNLKRVAEQNGNRAVQYALKLINDAMTKIIKRA